MKLVIVESPTKTRSLSKYLGKDFEVAATMGHIRDLPKSKMGVEIEKVEKGYKFVPQYIQVRGKGKQVKEIRSLVAKADRVVLATDPDREGEAIAWHVKELLTDEGEKERVEKKFERVVFHSITKEAVLKAMETPKEIDKDLVEAQQARRILDKIVGFRLSPVLWKKVRRGLSAGRVQSVAVRLIVEREAEIEAFKSSEYWLIGADLSDKKDKQFWAELIKINGKKQEVKSEKEAREVEADLKETKPVVTKIEKKERRANPRPPFKTSTMQQAAANRMGWSAKKTMSVAQSLYEHGDITYHRTDSLNLVGEVVEKIKAMVENKYGKEYLPEKQRAYVNGGKVAAQEAHEAIRPTDIGVEPDDFTGKGKMASDEKKLYQLIWQRAVASQMASAVYDTGRVEIEAKGKKEYLLVARGEVEKFKGYKKVYGERRDREDQLLPELTEKEKLELEKIILEQKFTQPPARYNDASLIRELEKKGIGRPSTYAPTITKILYRRYVERKERRFYATEIGKIVTKFLVKNFPDQLDYEFTAEMEDKLDKVAVDKLDWQQMLSDFYGPFEKEVEEVEKKAERVSIPVEKTGRKCPKCKKGEIIVREGRFGKFLSCDQFPECKYIENLVVYVEGAKCEKCGSRVVVKKTRNGREFYGCEKYPKCDWATWNKPKVEGEKEEEEKKPEGKVIEDKV